MNKNALLISRNRSEKILKWRGKNFTFKLEN